MLFTSKKPSFEYLRKKWTAKHRAVTQGLFDKHLRKVALGSLGGLMLLPTSGLGVQTNQILTDQGVKISAARDNNALLATELKDKMPSEMRPLNDQEEVSVSAVLTKDFGFNVSPELSGIRLNRSYGLIGGEQHLYRYPGDTVYAQADNAQDWAMYGSAGMAPNLGAWGYFAPSPAAMTQEDNSRERYYIAVQTFLAPGFSENVAKYRDFFKYRKMLVVNPVTGQSVVADIADAGPSEYTGKHLGGSPEVMEALGLAGGPRKGAVLYFFIDDPNNSVPLGPIKVPDQVLAKTD
jgi:hypothetical protein